MQLIRHLPEHADAPVALAIGNFDGLHLGHRAVIEAMARAAEANNLMPAVLTFEPHPRRFFGRAEHAFRLERLGTKLQRLREAGVARVFMPRFDAAFAGLSPEAFLNDVLLRQLGVRAVVTGENFAFGAKRAGDMNSLRLWGKETGVETIAVPPVMVGGEICSSSAIREALAAGDVARARRFLGRDYTLSGSVVHGDGRGKTIGFATANIALPSHLKHPAQGVYAVQAHVRGQRYDGVANFGVKPTLHANAAPAFEAHLFGVAEDFYGAHMEVALIARIRAEKKFGSLDALVAQIGEDCAAAKRVLGCTA